jgi:hypothetical protein
MLRWALVAMVLLSTSSAAAAEPFVIDPWLEPLPPPASAFLAFEPFRDIVDPWAGDPTPPLQALVEIVDPWADPARIPTAAFPSAE